MEQTTITIIASFGVTAVAIIGAFVVLGKSHNNISDVAQAAHATIRALLNNPAIVATLKAHGEKQSPDVKLLEGDLQELLNLINAPNTVTTITTNAAGVLAIHHEDSKGLTGLNITMPTPPPAA